MTVVSCSFPSGPPPVSELASFDPTKREKGRWRSRSRRAIMGSSLVPIGTILDAHSKFHVSPG